MVKPQDKFLCCYENYFSLSVSHAKEFKVVTPLFKCEIRLCAK